MLCQIVDSRLLIISSLGRQHGDASHPILDAGFYGAVRKIPWLQRRAVPPSAFRRYKPVRDSPSGLQRNVAVWAELFEHTRCCVSRLSNYIKRGLQIVSGALRELDTVPWSRILGAAGI